MKEQARLREEMAYQYKLGNFEVMKTILLCLCCSIIFFLQLIIDKSHYIHRPRLLFKEGWTQMLLCESY